MRFKQVVFVSEVDATRAMATWLGVPCKTLLTRSDPPHYQIDNPGLYASWDAMQMAQTVKLTQIGEWVLAARKFAELESAAFDIPGDLDEARAMLQKLSGRTHEVYTGIALFDPFTQRQAQHFEVSRVKIRKLSAEDIDLYLQKSDTAAQAGAYVLHSPYFEWIEGVEGCYANVAGLPFCAISKLLKEWGVFPHQDYHSLCRQQFGYVCNLQN